mmetsp:Transcript_47766/g.83618  ORF Transcript_47766/g.83618 Transcript_47766/m.83618 type:complete len:310 (-) Transcript_47766:96-1025(-)
MFNVNSSLDPLLLLLLLFILCQVNGHVHHETELFNRTASMRFIIPSGVNTSDRRHACRMSWLKWVKHVKHGTSYAFYVEAPVTDLERVKIKEESDVFNDILVINGTAPRDKTLQSCAFRRWEALIHDFSVFQTTVDYYVLVDDDCFVCVHHMLFASKFWPVGREQRVHISHFRGGVPDVISMYSSVLLQEALQVVSTNVAYKFRPLQALIDNRVMKNVDCINELRLNYGARGLGKTRYNDFTNGWVGADLLNATEKVNICHKVLSLHQAYPLIMMDLWNHLTANPVHKAYPVPVLSRNIINLDKTRGYL